ncbi:FAD/NAD(P)-binding protein [Insolitispirillum peregrinum]|uniref:Uncharacterized NAD(P)/FAD-binding protein YdhS n=1 Tax=Insolitispirillum peregrinum TaxID=80876 RepID=A0A1N7IHF2_9PROT|nr:FAD/NAD(P)-binding protein [Insolitispirillum peregrinum]SIS36529.1 Uncharacterized NAD(P)/FAD-binding protein YdhS [Insolitispirillum peregrinum]
MPVYPFSQAYYDVVVIGGGASAVAVLVALEETGDFRGSVAIVDPASRLSLGQGVAYGAARSTHLLNVPAGRMGLSIHNPADFLQWARAHGVKAQAEDFLPRRLYGSYLSSHLVTSSVNWSHLRGEAVDVQPTGACWLVTLNDQRRFRAGAVVLAVGGPASAPLPWSGSADSRPNTLIDDPWPLYSDGDDRWISSLSARLVPTSGPVLIVGSGLTMIDMVLSLRQARAAGDIHVLSRRGLWPLPYGTSSPLPPEMATAVKLWALSARQGKPLSRLWQGIRHLIRQHQGNGGDWRDIIEAVRHHLPALWPVLSDDDKRRFLRHGLPYWSIHRHRLPEQHVETLNALRQEGRLHSHKGRLHGLSAVERQTGRPLGIKAEFTPRGKGTVEHLTVDWVYNCTGASFDISKPDSPLIWRLWQRGLLQQGPAGLGVDVNTSGCVGSEHGGLYLIGPLARGRQWETTAMPDIRVQAARLATSLLRHQGGQSPRRNTVAWLRAQLSPSL